MVFPVVPVPARAARALVQPRFRLRGKILPGDLPEAAWVCPQNNLSRKDWHHFRRMSWRPAAVLAVRGEEREVVQVRADAAAESWAGVPAVFPAAVLLHLLPVPAV